MTPGLLRETLSRDGVVVINGVLSAREIERGVGLFWNALETMAPPLRRDSVASWRNQNWPRNYTTGIISEGQIAGSEYMWFARTRPNVVRLFEILHEMPASDLIVSLDTTRATRGQNTSHVIDLHRDQPTQGPLRHTRAFQAGINFTKGGPYQSGFSVIVGSHLHFPHGKIVAEHAIKPTVEAGSVTLWDMRTVHGVAPSPQKTCAPQAATLTLTAFVSYFPRAKRDKRALHGRHSAAITGAPQTHWAHLSESGTVTTWPRAMGSLRLTPIPPFYPEHRDKLEKWL